jgi:hypothetical protein
MRPRASTIEAIAFARITPGLASRPPQLPEWCAPSRSVQSSVKLQQPREPRKSVGWLARGRGPSLAISTSAASSRVRASQIARSPGEPISSPISNSHLTLKPRRPRVDSTCSSAVRLIVCWPLLSAVPRPYQRSPRASSVHGEAALLHCSS